MPYLIVVVLLLFYVYNKWKETEVELRLTLALQKIRNDNRGRMMDAKKVLRMLKGYEKERERRMMERRFRKMENSLLFKMNDLVGSSLAATCAPTTKTSGDVDVKDVRFHADAAKAAIDDWECTQRNQHQTSALKQKAEMEAGELEVARTNYRQLLQLDLDDIPEKKVVADQLCHVRGKVIVAAARSMGAARATVVIVDRTTEGVEDWYLFERRKKWYAMIKMKKREDAYRLSYTKVCDEESGFDEIARVNFTRHFGLTPQIHNEKIVLSGFDPSVYNNEKTVDRIKVGFNTEYVEKANGQIFITMRSVSEAKTFAKIFNGLAVGSSILSVRNE